MVTAAPLIFNRLRFFECRGLTDLLEGGTVHYQNDWGGKTVTGLTQTAYDEYRSRKGWPPQDVSLASPEERTEIFRWGYWSPARCGELSGPADFVLYQWAINRGPGGAVKDMQGSLGLKPDGSFGPKTMTACKLLSPPALSGKILDAQVVRYRLVVERSNRALFSWTKASPEARKNEELFPAGKPKDQREFAVGWHNRANRVAVLAAMPWRVPTLAMDWARAQDVDFEAGKIPVAA